MGIDLDHVIGADGKLDPKAEKIVEELPGYVEKSPSGTGLHMLIKGELPPPGERSGLKFGALEFYDETTPRYLTLTGDVWEGRAEYNANDATETISAVYRNVQKAFEEEKERSQNEKKQEYQQAQETKNVHNDTKPSAKCFDHEDDTSLLEHIRNSKQGIKFTSLFDQGDISAYKSKSEAVAATLFILAWWTNKDEARMDRIFRRSAIYDDEKWNRPQRGETWGSLEINSACRHCVGGYTHRKEEINPAQSQNRSKSFAARCREEQKAQCNTR